MNVRKYYNKHLILEIPALQLKKGFYWIKGANGAGKTTLLKMIAGLIPFDGDISFNGINLRKHPLAYRRNISWAEAEPTYPPFMTGAELIALYQKIRKATVSEVTAFFDLFNMRDYMNSAIGTYSAGMVKKLSLVLAFLGSPALVILDEPFITLDPDALTKVCTYIHEQQANSNTTFIMSSHQELDAHLLSSGEVLTVNNKQITG